MANKKISELTSVTLPLAGTEEVAIVQSGVTKKVAVSEFSGSSLRTGRYEFLINNTFNASTLWYAIVRLNSTFNGLSTYSTGYYNGTTNSTIDNRVWAIPMTYKQKVTKVTISKEYVQANLTMRLQYFEINPLGGTLAGVNNNTILEVAIPTTGGATPYRNIVTYIPTDFTMQENGLLFVSFYNANTLCNVYGMSVIVDTIEVI